jgi:hypothetical protein
MNIAEQVVEYQRQQDRLEMSARPYLLNMPKRGKARHRALASFARWINALTRQEAVAMATELGWTP